MIRRKDEETQEEEDAFVPGLRSIKLYISSSCLSLSTLKRGSGNTRQGVRSSPLSDTHTLPHIADVRGRNVKMSEGEETDMRERERCKWARQSCMKAVCSDRLSDLSSFLSDPVLYTAVPAAW